MTISLLEPPLSPAPPARRRRAFVVLLIGAALLGGAATAGLLLLLGVIADDTSSTTTVVMQVSGDGSAAGGIDAGAVYTSAAGGVVNITSRVPSEPTTGPFGEPRTTETIVTGSGFVVDADGRIVTAAHVVDDASRIDVKLQGGATRSATVLGQDDATDVAVLGIDPDGLDLHPLRIGSSDTLKIGAAVAAIGDPFEYERSISTGVVSGLDRTIEAPNGAMVAHAIQTDAALNPGNSGGPLLDRTARVVGVIDQIATSGSTDQNSGVGFAVPSAVFVAELAKLDPARR